MPRKGDIDGERAYGPSWYDIEQMKGRMEREWDCSIYFEVTCYQTKMMGPPTWNVTARHSPPKQISRPTELRGSHMFRGKDGARTMPAAMYLALVNLEDKLWERHNQAEAQSSF